MSNYTIAVNWSGKDALSDSDAAKVISGSDFNTEFTTVQTAVNTKANINGSSVESFSATTATAGTNTTQVATTAFVTAATPEAFPVGSVFTSVVSTNPSTLLGYGTWSTFAAGKMLVGLNSGDADFDTVEETGGSKTHTLTEAEMPAHTHIVPHTYGNNYSESGITWSDATGTTTDKAGQGSIATHANKNSASTGSGTAHNIMNPYITVYMWKRTA